MVKMQTTFLLTKIIILRKGLHQGMPLKMLCPKTVERLSTALRIIAFKGKQDPKEQSKGLCCTVLTRSGCSVP